MLIDALLNFLIGGSSGMVTQLVQLLPAADPPDLSGLAEAVPFMSWAGLFIDITYLRASLAYMIATEVVIFALRFALFVWSIIWS